MPIRNEIKRYLKEALKIFRKTLLYTKAVNQSMMPKGVEHLRGYLMLMEAQKVNQSMMPKGVEHMQNRQKTFDRDGESIYDAERR